MDVMDEGTKAAVAEQLRLGEELRQKVYKPCLRVAKLCMVYCSYMQEVKQLHELDAHGALVVR